MEETNQKPGTADRPLGSSQDLERMMILAMGSCCMSAEEHCVHLLEKDPSIPSSRLQPVIKERVDALIVDFLNQFSHAEHVELLRITAMGAMREKLPLVEANARERVTGGCGGK